ncbi:twin-arginine translocation pathway signal [Mycobacterium sp. 050134]|uniref:twin-arginine translocation pathway signal n=1 Tax=Mycobacterium sp. 050134 TaxID=3096111 RepID=UPI002ED92B04
MVDAKEPEDIARAEDADDHGPTPGRPQRMAAWVKKRTSGKLLGAALACLVVASLALLGAMYWLFYRPDSATDPAVAKSAINAASEGAVAVLSYSPDTLDRDFSSAKSHLTGDFLSYYDQFTQQIVAPAARQKSVKTTAVVLRAAVSDLRPGSAVVLLFVNQSTQSKDRPEPTFTSSSVSVTLTKADGKWLISSFNPV